MGPKDLDPYKMQNLVNQYPCESFEPFEMGKLIFFFHYLGWNGGLRKMTQAEDKSFDFV